MILSDIIGDPLDLIASGPTVPNCSTPKDCVKIFQEFNISLDDIPSSVLQILNKTADSTVDSSSAFSHVNNVLIGSNSIAVAAAQERAKDMGFETWNISKAIDGEAKHVATTFVDLARYVCEKYMSGSSSEAVSITEGFKVSKEKIQELEDMLEKAVQGNKPVCVIGAGETTVSIRGTGKGGRNQELALAAGIAMHESSALQTFYQDGFHVTLLSAGTDGQDGPTDAAGAVADISQVIRASKLGFDPAAYLDNNDSYTFYNSLEEGRDLMTTGLTGTNVMDIQILLVYPPAKSL